MYIAVTGGTPGSCSSSGKSKSENQILADTRVTTVSLESVEGNELQECKLQREKVLDREERQSHKPFIWSGCTE